MTAAYSDIEIYIKRPDMDALRTWLDQRFTVSHAEQKGDSLILQLADPPIECVIVENAVSGGYTSVWFRSDQTPWQDDRECALEAFHQLKLEVRCAAAPWDETAADEQAWLRLTEAGEQRVNWRT